MRDVAAGFKFEVLMIQHRFIPHALNTQALTPARITGIVAQTKNVMFPNGYPGPSPVEPTREEQLLLREQLEMRLLDLVPCTQLPLSPFSQQANMIDK